MACRYTYQGKTYEAAEFDDVLRTMRPDTAAQYMPTVKSIPAAPFVTATDKWLTLALKRIIVMAAQEGYDRVAFINGDQSADRYDLSKQINMASAIANGDGTYNLVVEGKGGLEIEPYSRSGKKVTPAEMEDTVGKDLAKKLIDGAESVKNRPWPKNSKINPAFFTVRGLDLKVGGEGMKAFYDTILPNTLKSVLKKLGGGEAHAWGASVLPDNLQFTITPAMREKASQGLPLFRATQGTKPGGLSKAAVQLVVDDITKNWKDGPNVRVVESASEMPFNAPADTNGAYYKGTVWIVSKAHHNKAKIARTLAHEAIAHYGLRNMLGGDGFRRYMGNIQLGLKAKNKQLLAIQADVRKAYVDENGKFNLTPNQEADEIAARAVELAVDENGNFKPGLGFLKSVYARIMEFLRDLGFTFHVTHAELQGMLVLAQRNIEVGSRTSGGGDMVVAASRGKNDPVTNQQDVVGNQGGRSADDKTYGPRQNLSAAEEFKRAIESLSSKYEVVIEQDRGGSVYAQVLSHTLKNDGSRHQGRSPVPVGFKARFADHGSYWGSTISIDPLTGNSIDDAVALFKFENKLSSQAPTFNRSRIIPESGEQLTIPVTFNENVWKNGGKDYWREGKGVPATQQLGNALAERAKAPNGEKGGGDGDNFSTNEPIEQRGATTPDTSPGAGTALPKEMTDRGVTMFDGLRTREGGIIARGFLTVFNEQEKESRPSSIEIELFGATDKSEPRRYEDRFDATKHDLRQQAVVAQAIEAFRDGGPITPRKALFIADLMQMQSAIPSIGEKVYMLMPEEFKNDDYALEDFGSVSHKNFDPMDAYNESYLENRVNGANPKASIKYIDEVLDADPLSSRKSIKVTNTELAERFLKDPTKLIRTLVEITRFVRDSNEASYSTFIENYSPRLLAEERSKEAKRLADYLIANAALGKKPNEPTAPDSDGADIRFSRGSLSDTLREATNNVRSVKLPAGYQVSDLMDGAPGKLNWWHKTVGTQYNLAKRFPAFGRVFDTVQEFLHDVSYFATEAGNLAPNIIPKLETVRDIWKSPMKAADAKAIRAPIFEGTLVWGRDENGRAVKMAVLEAKAATMDAQDKAQSLLQHRLLDPMVLRMWQGLPLEQFEAIINAKYDREVLKPGVVWTDTELRNQFNLDKNQIALYREFRKATDKSLSDLSVTDMIRFAGKSVEPVADIAREAGTVDEAAEVLRNYLHSLADAEKESNPKRYKELMDTANKVQMKAAQAEDLKARGYAPLSRFGSHFVDVLDQDGERVYFGLFESATEAKRMARDMQAQFPKAKRIGQGTVSQEAYKLFAGVTPETLELFGDMLGVEHGNNPAFQAYLKAAKSTRSAMRRLIERKGIAGFSEDAGRVLAGFIYSNARQASSNLHMGRMSEAAADKDAFRGDGQLQDQAVKLVDYVKNPVEEAQAVRGLLFAQYIGGSVASALVNITQPVTMTFPWLSQFGGARLAAAEMSKAMKDASKRMWDNKSTGDKALDAALHRAEEDGTVSPQEVHQLVNQASGGGALRPGDGTRLGDAAATLHNTLSRVSLGWGKMFGAAEQFNRQATFIAAYRIAQKQGMKDPDAFARQATVEANGIYNKGNKPAWARGAVGSTLFTFKQFSIAYVEMLDRMARSGPDGKKAALRALAVLFLVAGAGGMPGADDLDDIISGAMQKLGYNFDSKSKRQEFFASLVGEGGAKFLERGVSGLPGVPIDVAGRFGLGNLVPGTGLFQTKKDHTRDVAEIAGPAGDLAKRTFEAAGKLVKGDMLGHDGAMATMAPKAIQNLAQAHDMATMGMYRDQNGKKVLDTDGFDAMAKAIGFQPNDVSRVQKAAFDAQRMIELNKARETEIADKWAKGIFEKDPDAVREAKRDMHDWNADNPDSKIRIKFDQILQRVRKMNQTKAQRIAATAPREIRAQVRRELEQ